MAGFLPKTSTQRIPWRPKRQPPPRKPGQQPLRYYLTSKS